MSSEHNQDILMISNIEGVENCAKAVAVQLNSRVDIMTNRKSAISLLRQQEFGVVVVDENLVEGDPVWADVLWQNLGTAIPMQVNFAISGTARLTREIRAALARRDSEQQTARRAAVIEIENDLKSSVTGLLLQSELALQEPSIPANLEPKLRQLAQLAGEIRQRLEPKPAGHTLLRAF